MFGTSGVRGPVGSAVTAGLALDIGHALAAEADCVVVGRDARDSGRALVDALAAGLVECGVDVVDLGVAATPTIARAVGTQNADAGVAITASHNPPQDNGLKLWTPSGQAFDDEQLAAIEERIDAADPPYVDWDAFGRRTTWTLAGDAHRRALVAAGRRRTSGAERSLAKLHVVVDIGNGMGGITADALYELGATVETLNGQPDGRFPGRPSEPTATNCAGLCAYVAASNADLGLAHDGDADRLLAVDDRGQFVSGDTLLAIFALATATAGDRIAAPVDTSLAVDDALSAIGATVTRTRVGDGYVAAATREEDVVFGGEPSGAWIFPAETRCPDGPLAGVVLSVLAAERSLATRVDSVLQYPIRRETIETTAKGAVMDRIAEQLRGLDGELTEIDGIRIGRDDGWFLLRASGTQPLIRLTAEAREPAIADRIRDDARAVVDRALAADAPRAESIDHSD